ncbi:YhdP family protein [Zoogloea sp.]|uniref:YhdP family protein n=1 Tax=Zoogloea sp. TaxID=49181 RepID=UPI0025D3A264|nr:YhdP family protein [Zoogloea sp.]MCK6392763.1 TIGR02099 family protein [Zoogloea sp.]
MAEGRLSFLHLPRLCLQRLAWAGVIAYFVFGLAFLVLRHGVLPKVPDYRGEVAQMLSRSLGLPVDIASLSADWQGLHPRLQMGGLTIRDAAGQAALSLDRVDAEVGWSSLWLMRLRLHRLEIDSPQLAIRRNADGQVFVAGLPVAAGGDQGDFSSWLLDQRQVVIRNARLEWSDALRGAETLVLDKLEFRLDNRGDHHRFGLRAQPPARLAAALDLRGDLRGRDPARPAEWRGELYASLDYADLGAWRVWVDYPLDVSGAGGVRAWLELADGRLLGATADFALRDARVRLAPDLEDIAMSEAAGRLRVRREKGGLEASGRKLRLQTRDGLVVAPTDFFLRVDEATATTPARGEFVANQLDLGVLSRLAGRLPFDGGLRKRLATLAPAGRVAPVDLKWSLKDEALATYAVDARFEGVGIEPLGAWPGFAGVAGRIAGNEKGGRFTLSGRDAALELPQVFPESHLRLSELAAEGSWSHPEGALEVTLASSSFANHDARGTASGRYRATPDTPGQIDLQAHLTEADATAVWRYIPHVVGKTARDWLQQALVGGKAADTRLVLKGDLSRFPFRNPRDGSFRVAARIRDGQLDYAPGWPKIEDVAGELLFEGAGMTVKARHGRIFGVDLQDVSAVLPDFESDAVLTVRGSAHGATQDFLRFIAESPVAGMINHFTDPFQADGRGKLDLQLVLPLHKLNQSRVKGDYQFTRNQLQLDAAMPVLTEATGRVEFTESQLNVRSGAARIFGDPVSVSGGSRADGSILLNAQGSLGMPALRKELGLPLLDHLSGSAAWKGSITVMPKGGVEFVLDSGLLGVSSSLPEPLNKSATGTLPFRFEMIVPPAGGVPGDTLKLAAGSVFQAQFQRRREGRQMVIARGGMALNEPVRLADKGVLVAARADRLDADAWRKALAGKPAPVPADSAENADAGHFPLSGLALRAGELLILGQRLGDVNLRAVMEEGGWQARLSSKEASGDILWRDQGRGRLQARFKQLSIGSAQGAPKNAEPAATDEERLSALPGLDVTADSFILRGHALGRLDLKAANRGDNWRLEQLSIVSPDGSLSGDGVWRPGAREETRLNFKLDVGSVEKMLSRLGYPEAVRRGQGNLEGQLVWKGPPTALHLPSLGGRMNVRVESGQFTQLEPGVGRLLGVLNLQALPRRITLDFRDVFSEGFAFDRISGSIRLDSGVLRTDDLEIFGPAARVFMSGEADAARETQNLRVKVQPTLSESIAVGSAIATTGAINPALGLAAYLVQKALRDPVEKLFSFEYAVTGGWSDPKVEKLSDLPVASPQPAVPSRTSP